MSLLEHRILGLPLESDIKRKLKCCGFDTVGDLKDYLDVDKLRSITKLADRDIHQILTLVKCYISPEMNDSFDRCGIHSIGLSTSVVMKSLGHILNNTTTGRVGHIVSFSSQVDNLLGGGFPVGKIIEIAGEAGLGKTQFAFQLCVDVQIPKVFGGLASEAVFLDVEGTFIPQRVEQIAEAAIKHCHYICDQQLISHEHMGFENFTIKGIMSRIYLFRCIDAVQLMASCHQMTQFLKNHTGVKLLIIDSIAHSLRVEDDYIARTRFLLTLKGIFLCLLRDFDISIIIINQVTTRIRADDNSYNIPALGAKWSHVPNIKLMLYKHGNRRFLRQYKSPSHPDGIAEYCVVKEGIRDVTS